MEIGIIIICLILSAFFSGMEIAFVSSNKIYLELEKKQNSFISKILKKLTEKPTVFIATMHIGNTVVLVIYGFLMSSLLMETLSHSGYVLSVFFNLAFQIGLSGALILITSEFLPKIFFQIYANSFMKFFVLPAYVFYPIFFFIAVFFIWISDVVLRKVFKIKDNQINLSFTKIELGNYISEQMNTVDENQPIDSEIKIFQNALEFSTVKAKEIMSPRTELIAVDLYSSISSLRQLFINTGYSKILVYQHSLDEIIGYVHSFELFKKPKTIKSIMIAIEFVPETIFIKEVMNLLTKKRKSIAVVLDEYGGTSGIITMEDIVEELFGEIEDEHDSDLTLIETRLDEKTYLFSARLNVEYVNQKYKLHIPESDSYGTLGGFIVSFSKEIPLKGNQIIIGNYYFLIEEATNSKIELVKMTISD